VSDPASSRSSVDATPAAPGRVIIDSSSRRWAVYEFPANGAPGDRPSLVFESRDAVRRVRDFPADWRWFSDEELHALSWRR
jgi:hypothetical protein